MGDNQSDFLHVTHKKKMCGDFKKGIIIPLSFIGKFL